MASFTERLTFLINLEGADQAARGFNKVGTAAEKDLRKAEDGLSHLGGQMTKFGAGAMAFAGVASAALFGMAKASDEANLAQEKLTQTIETMPQLAGASADAFNDLAAAIQDKTAADADQIVSGQALAGQMGLTQAQILELTPLAVDLARKMGVDMDTAFKTAAKAAMGSEGALKKMGVSVNEAAHEVDPFRATVDALGQSVGGFAEREGKTFSGSLERMKNQAGDVAEAIGTGAIPVFDMLSSGVGAVVDAFNGLPAPVQKGVGGFAAFAVAATGAVGALSFVGGQVMKTIDNVKNFGAVLSKVNPMVLGVTAAVGLAATAYLAYSSSKERAKRITQEYTDALIEQGIANKDEVAQLRLQGFATDEITKILQEYGITLSDVADFISGKSVPAIDALGLKYNWLRLAIVDEREAMEDAIANAQEHARVNERLAETTGTARREVVLMADETSKLAEGMGEAIDSGEELASVTEGVADMARNAADALGEQQDSLNELIDAQMAATDAAYGYQNAQWAAEDAVNALKEAEQTAAPFSRDLAAASMEAEQAVLGQAEAALKLAEDQAAANGTTLTAQERAAVLRAELDKLKTKFPELTPFIDDYIGRLSSIPSRIKTILEIEERFTRRNDDRIISDTYGGSTGDSGRFSASAAPINLYVDGKRFATTVATASWAEMRAIGAR